MGCLIFTPNRFHLARASENHWDWQNPLVMTKIAMKNGWKWHIFGWFVYHLPIETYWNGDVRCSIIDMFHCQKVILKEKADGVKRVRGVLRCRPSYRQLQKRSWISLKLCVRLKFMSIFTYEIYWNMMIYNDLPWIYHRLSMIYHLGFLTAPRSSQIHLGPHRLDEGWRCRHLFADGAGDLWKKILENPVDVQIPNG